MSTSSKDLADTYQEKTDIEHILDAPDTYIGSVESDEINGWTINAVHNWATKQTYSIPSFKALDFFSYISALLFGY